MDDGLPFLIQADMRRQASTGGLNRDAYLMCAHCQPDRTDTVLQKAGVLQWVKSSQLSNRRWHSMTAGKGKHCIFVYGHVQDNDSITGDSDINMQVGFVSKRWAMRG